MSRATLGGGGIQYPSVQQYVDWVMDFGTANNGGPANFQSGGVGNVNTLAGPDGRPCNPVSGTAASNGVNVNAFQDDGNGRAVISLGGGIVSGGSVNGGVYGFANHCGYSPQLIKPTTAAPLSIYPVEQQAALYDFWLQFGPLGIALNRGDTGVSLLMGNGTVPSANPMHNVNTGGGTLSGGVPGIGVLLFPDGFLHVFSATSIAAGGTVGINDTFGAPPTDICRISFLIQAATLTTNATFSWYLNKVLQRTYTWALGGGHPLPLWTDTAGQNQAAFLPQFIACPPGQDAQAHNESGIYVYGFRFRRGPAAQIFAGFASS
jgi:hypothetical protein